MLLKSQPYRLALLLLPKLYFPLKNNRKIDGCEILSIFLLFLSKRDKYILKEKYKL